MLYHGGGGINMFAEKQLVIGVVLFYIHHFLSKYSSSYPKTPFRWYIGDLLSLIVCVPIFVNIQIALKIRTNKTNATGDIIFYTILFSIYYEIILPKKSNLFTGDIIDIACYFVSGMILYLSLCWKKNEL
jgi:hypothetical protein